MELRMMGALGYSLVLVLFAAHQCDGDMDHFNDYKALHPHHVNSNWMKCIPDDQSFSAVSIPGTDQSLKEGGWNPYRNFQAWKLSSQLYAGVRFFDMTVWMGLFGTLYVANNAVYYYEYFEHAVSELQNFLSAATSETVLLRLTGYADAISLAKEMLSKGTGFHLWKDRNIPKMGEARGKIVLIQSPDFHWGLPINAMELPTEDKVTQMKANIEYASEHCKNEMMLTDTGAKGQNEIPLPVAEKLNKQIDDYLLSLLHSEEQPSCIGIIAMDFSGPKLIQQIIILSCHSGTGSNEPDTGIDGVVAVNETLVSPIPVPTPKTTPIPITEPTPKSTTQSTTESTPESTTQSTTESTTESSPIPITESTPESTTQSTTESTTPSTTESTTESTPIPINEPTPESTTQSTTEPTTNPPTKPAHKIVIISP